MELPSIEQLASKARDYAKSHKVSMRTAIHAVADAYEVDCSDIGKELSKRAAGVKKHNKKAQQYLQDKEHEEALAEIHKHKLLHDAYIHEIQMKRGFQMAGHMDDY